MHRYEACSSQAEGANSGIGDDVARTYGDHKTTSHLSLRSPTQNGGEAPPTTSHVGPRHSTEADLKKDKSNQHRSTSTFDWRKDGRLLNIVLGLYLLSSILAGAHCLFFQYLDGRILRPDLEISSHKTTMVPQGYVTATSFLLVTAFRAALVASVGICYTQYLWAILRTRALKVSLVEDLFQMQTNALHLASTGIYAKTPILAAVAIFCWLIPIATVYPPTTLVVDLIDAPMETPLYVPVFHAKDYMYTTRPLALSKIECKGGPEDYHFSPLNRDSLQGNASILKTCRSRWSQNSQGTRKDFTDLTYIARLSLISGELANLALPNERNTSYAIQFWGTTLDCQVLNRTVEMTITSAEDYSTAKEFAPTWAVRKFDRPRQLWSDNTWNLGLNSTFEHPRFTYRKIVPSSTYRYFPCVDIAKGVPVADQLNGNASLPETGTQVLVDVTDTVCQPKFTEYTLNASFVGGRQHVAYHLDSQQSTPAYSETFGNFSGSYEQWVHFSDALSVYYEYADNFNQAFVTGETAVFNFTDISTVPTLYTASNGTIVETCSLSRSPMQLAETDDYRDPRTNTPVTPEIWPLSVFERGAPRNSDGNLRAVDYPYFDTEMANELLINTTISALSLKKTWDTVNGTVTRAFNIYRFHNKVAFFVPYGLSLGLAIPIIILGLAAFYTKNNKTDAITGGFLQLLMTTSGRTQLEKLLTGPVTDGGRKNVTDELKEAEITFGELIESDSEDTPLLNTTQHDEDASRQSEADLDIGKETKERRVGFGLVQEVRRPNVKPLD